ncbi:unnamed protein product [Mytilus coruscus]|uniref:Uncharacterized protein n=1 Tax=Mytilus coruscus TaxID=42192 RepID=A0A6J8BLW4_MYTCO|nr:unnamed protein product [Mytilus coruscus]
MEQTDVIMTIYIPRMYGIDYVFNGIFDKKIIKQCEKKIREMEKELNLHRQIYMQLQKQQKVCWLANNKVEKYQKCLDTSKKVYDYTVRNLSKRGESVKQRNMNKIQNHLQEKLKQAKRAEKKYKTLLEHESKIRSSIKKVELDIFKLIELHVNDRTPTSTTVNTSKGSSSSNDYEDIQDKSDKKDYENPHKMQRTESLHEYSDLYGTNDII